MKKLVTLSALMLAAATMHAQIDITQAAYASWTPATDSFYTMTGVNFMPAANGMWDLTAHTYDSSYTNPKPAYTNASMPDATYLVPSFYAFSSYNYLTNLAYGISLDGIQAYGETMERQAYSLTAVTGGAQDSLVFLQQDIMYTSPRTELAFPASYGAMWSSDYNFSTNFTLTAVAFFMNNTPCSRKSHTTRVDSVAGWGQMRGLNASGDTSDYTDVLVVKTRTTVSDSFYLNGAPASATLLSAFGVSQDMKSYVYSISYYRAGEVDPLLIEKYSDSTYTTQTVAQSHVSRLKKAATTAVGNIAPSDNVFVYPNPVINGNLTIHTGTDGKWSYNLVNVAGQAIASGNLKTNSGNTTVKINAQPGMYSLKLYNNGKAQSTQSLLVK